MFTLSVKTMRLTQAAARNPLQKLVALILCITLILSATILPAQAATKPTVTPAQIAAVQQIYPEGTVCTNSTPEFRVCVHWPGVMISAQACWGFAIVFVAKLYDLDLKKNLSVTCLEINKTMPEYYPKTPYYSAQKSVEIGDILAAPGHAMVVIAKDSTGVTIGEGNYGGHVHYGRRLSYDGIDNSINYILRILPSDDSSSSCPCSNFRDMPAEGSPEHEAIDWAYTHEPRLTAGTSSINFSPDQTVTRAMALTFLWRAAGMPEPRSSSCPFDDVPSDAYYREAVLWAVENGITCGTSRTTFSPKQTCSRSEILTFIWRAIGSPSPQNDSTYSDAPHGKWYATPATWARENAVEPGQNGLFAPHTPCTRASTILYIYRAFEGSSPSGCTP